MGKLYIPKPNTSVRITELHRESSLTEFDITIGSVVLVRFATEAVEPGWLNLWPQGRAVAGFCRVEPT